MWILAPQYLLDSVCSFVVGSDWQVGYLSFLSEVDNVSSFWDHIDLSTFAAIVVALLLVFVGWHDRRERKNGRLRPYCIEVFEQRRKSIDKIEASMVTLEEVVKSIDKIYQERRRMEEVWRERVMDKLDQIINIRGE